VVTDLASLRGPSRGAVELPLRLYWSGPSPMFDLSEPYLARWLYQIVLREASRPEDLTSYLDRDMLIALWPQLRLPRGVRQAWEERHPRCAPRPGRPDAGQRPAPLGRRRRTGRGTGVRVCPGRRQRAAGPRSHLPAHPGRRPVHRPGTRRPGSHWAVTAALRRAGFQAEP